MANADHLNGIEKPEETYLVSIHVVNAPLFGGSGTSGLVATHQSNNIC